MKQITINDKCIQCGTCIVKCPEYFAENEDGSVKLIASFAEESNELTETVNICPVNAIELSDEKDKTQSLNVYISQLNELAKGIKLEKSDLKFGDSFLRPFTMPGGSISGFEYKSSSRAESAGYDAFVSRSYSQVETVALERITEYRISVLKPYYSSDESSVYYKYNNKVADVLKAIEKLVGNGKLPSDFCTVNVYPNSRDIIVKMLNKGEVISSEMASVVKSELICGVSDYKVYINTDDMEDYRGKDVYNYNTFEATEELAKDLTDALRYAKDRIEDSSFDFINSIVNNYNKDISAIINNKIKLVK